MGQTRSMHRTRRILLLALPFLLPACSETPLTGDTDGSLTEAEARALADQLGLASLAFGQARSQALGATWAPGGLPWAAPSRTQTITVTYGLTRPCVLGGTVYSSGRIDVQTDTLTDLAIVDLTTTDVHHDCVFLANGTRVSVSGDPDVTTTIHVASLAGEPQGTQSVRVEGGLRFVTDDGRTGHCALDITVEVDESVPFQSTRGTMCGFAFDVTVQG